jgi:murein L,D-transpeptidase YafK
MLTALLLGLAGCAGFAPEPVVKTGHVQPETLRLMSSLDMDRGAPILIRVFKQDSILEVWKQDHAGRYGLLKSYPICRFSGALGPKKTEGDHQAPEGFYEITREQLNPYSHEYLAFNVGYPNKFDQSLGRTGSFVMVHGGCRSVGCYAMTDAQMDEIYGLVYEALQSGQDRIQLQALPFQMTAQNLAQHSDDPNRPFWAMLKSGSDAFIATRTPPRVAVCGQQYVFNAGVSGDSLDPSAPCPPGIGPAVASNGPAEVSPMTARSSSYAAHQPEQNGDSISQLIEQNGAAQR